MSPPVHSLLLPGWMMPGSVFDPLLARLKHPARAAGSCTTLDWTLALDPGELAAAVRRVPGPCRLVGWSLGAQAGLRLALDPPPNLRHLLLLGATARLAAAPGYEGVAPGRLRAMRQRLVRDPEGLLREFFQLCHAPRDGADPRPEHWLEQALGIPRETADAGLALLAETDLRAELHRVRIPTTLLHGASDAVVPPSQARLLAGLVPGCRLHMLPRRGHWPATDARPMLQALVPGHFSRGQDG